MAEERTPESAPQGARPTGKRQLTGVSTTSSAAYEQKRAAAAAEPQDKLGGGPMHFLPEVGQEMKKVIWPTKTQMLNYTLIVFGFLIVMMALVWGVDVLAAKGVDLVLNRG